MGNGADRADEIMETVNQFQYPMGNGAKTYEVMIGEPFVSIPYGKWSQQQFVAGAIIAHKSLHVKKFL